MNRSAEELFIETTNLDGLIWLTAQNLPNSLNFLPAKLPRYMLGSS